MYKTQAICSLLMAFGLSAVMVGCDAPKTTATKPAPKAAGPGSSTGGGTEVPATPSTGTSEVPKAPEKADESKGDEAPKN